MRCLLPVGLGVLWGCLGGVPDVLFCLWADFLVSLVFGVATNTVVVCGCGCCFGCLVFMLMEFRLVVLFGRVFLGVCISCGLV